MSPADCKRCVDSLDGPNWLLGAELRFIAATTGGGAARAELNERLNDFHNEHGGRL